MKYAMTSRDHSCWEDCRATTERGAKAEAWTRYKGGYNGDVIYLAVVHDSGEREKVARRANVACSKWTTIY